MRPRLAAAALFLALAAASARAGLFGRSRLVSRWTATPLAVNADDADWDDSAAFEEDGLAVFARNDGDDLYLLLTAHTKDARAQVNGGARQDLTFWFVGLDGKTREWGARLPFSRRAALTSDLRDPAGIDPEPEFVTYRGAEVSSGTLPGDVVDRMAEVARRPIWELRIPLKRLPVSPEKTIAMDFVLNAPFSGARRRRRPPQERGRKDVDEHPEELVWNAQSYALSIHLASDPSLPR